MNELLLLSGVKLAELIKQGKVSSQEVVEVHIEQIKKVNPIINAVVKDRFDEAIQEAKKADELVQSEPKEKLPPFLGVPCTIKEMFAFKGMPNTSGLYSRRGIIAEEDAPTVARLKQAGAIPLGVTNIPELCMWFETYNKVYGRTNNPYDPKRIVGGSSGGEGAIIGAGGSPFGLGSDLGGSIRMPAFFNGVFGHKPSSCLIPNTGQFPIAENEALKYLTAGPLARRAEDLMPLLNVLKGPDGKDPYCREMELGDPSKVEIKELKVIVVPDIGVRKVSKDLKEAQLKAVQHLKEKGARVLETKIEKFKYAFSIWSSMLSLASETSFSTLLGGGKKINPWIEFLKWIFRASDHTFPGIIFAMAEVFPKITPGLTKRLYEMGKELKKEITELIGENGVLLFPPHPRPAFPHYRSLLRPFDFIYTGIFNVLELPVTEVPMGLNAQGIPLGVQVAGIHGNDHITIAVALELERAFGGWIPPKLAQ